MDDVLNKKVKQGGRWVINTRAPDSNAATGIQIRYTRKGLEVFGWFDHVCGVGDTWVIPWDEVERRRIEIDGKLNV